MKYKKNESSSQLVRRLNNRHRTDTLVHSSTLEINCTDFICSNNDQKYCSCDDLCHVFGDCCGDVFNVTLFQELQEQNKRDTFLYEKSKGINAPIEDLINFGKCQSILSNESILFYTMVSSCPISYNKSEMTRDLCENMDVNDPRNIAVSYKHSRPSQISYRNIFCAHCHGLKMEDILPWTIDVVCSNDDSFSETYSELVHYLSNNDCKVYQNPPEFIGEQRKCFDKDFVFSECLEKGDNFSKQLCHGYLSPVESVKGIFRNRHCLQCSNVTNQLQEPKCISMNYSFSELKYAAANKFKTTALRLLTENENLMWGKEIIDLKPHCPSGEIYDLTIKYCRSQTCPKDLYTNIGTCHFHHYDHVLDDKKTIPIHSNNSFESTITVTLMLPSVQPKKETVMRNFIDLIDTYMKTPLRVEETLPNTVSLTLEMHDNLTNLILDLTNFVRTQNRLDPVNDFHILIENVNQSDHYFCRDRDYIKYENASTITVKQYNNYLFGEIPNVDIYVRLDVTKFSMKISRNSYTLNYISFCFYHICPSKSKYNSSQVIFHEGLVTFDGRTIEATHFTHKVLGDQIYMCEMGDLSVIPIDGPTQGLLSTVCLMLSILSLLILVIFHILFKTLQNLHGQILVSFSLSLMTASILFVSQNMVSEQACKYYAVIRHYIWLCTFQWSCIMAYDLKRMARMNSPVPRCNGNQCRRLLVYNITAFVGPLPLIVVCCLLEFGYEESAFKMEYGRLEGDNTACWIHNTIGNVVFFAVPLSLVILFNITCFFITLCEIEKIKRKTKNIRKNKSEKNRCKIYGQITILLGVTWLVSFVASYYRNTVVVYANILINGLQGTFIFIGFLQSSKVLFLIRVNRWFYKKKTDHKVELYVTEVHHHSSAELNETKV